MKVLAFLKSLVTKLFMLALVVATGWFFTQGAVINGKGIPEDYFYSGGYPSILVLMNAEAFTGFVSLVTLIVFVYVAYLAWELHEIAVHKAQATLAAHVGVVTALSLCGLFINKAWWVLAIVIAFTNWKALGDSIANYVKRLKEV